uniref:Uncharacterized protein n=1 Tax=Anguilla anguilla TaxID=7936 RepID=A0A0E9QDI1_ANGAN
MCTIVKTHLLSPPPYPRGKPEGT